MRRHFVLLLLAAVVLLASRSGVAQEARQGPKKLADTLTGDAKTDYVHGLELLETHDPATAELKFKDAYEKAKDPRLLRNIGICETKQRHYAKAIVYLRRYVDEGGALLTAEHKQEAQENIETIAGFVVGLKITVTEADAEVYVDDERVGTSPLLKPVVVDIGERVVRAKKEGFRELVTRVQAAGAADVPVQLALQPEMHAVPAPAPVPAPTPEPAKSAGGPSVLTWIFAGVGVLGLGTALATGIMATDAKDTVNAECNKTSKFCSAAGYDAAQKGQAAATVATIAFLAGVGFAALAVVGFITAPKSGAKKADLFVRAWAGGGEHRWQVLSSVASAYG